jgi:hypothetical protein
LLLVRLTETSEGALPLSVTVAVDDAPPTTVEGFSDSDETTIEPGVAGAGMMYV